MRSGGRVVEGARLESEYTSKAYRGFESLPLRHLPNEVSYSIAGFLAHIVAATPPTPAPPPTIMPFDSFIAKPLTICYFIT